MKVGILGGGQLAQLLALKAPSLGIETLCFCDSEDVPAAKYSKLYIGQLSDQAALRAFAKEVDIITLENENISTAVIDFLTPLVPVYPDKTALYYAQDRLYEKTLFNCLYIPTARFYGIQSQNEITKAIAHVGLPAILKTRCFGYDGKGQYTINTPAELSTAVAKCQGVPLILEEKINFEGEVSIIGAQNSQQEQIIFPLIKNSHTNGILRTSMAPFNASAIEAQATHYIQKLLRHLNYIGLLTLELFVQNGSLFANEMAPRVHNSGHLTLEAANISQFESHLQAISGHSLTMPKMQQFAMMINVIGQFPDMSARPNQQEISIYNYGKKARAGRKLGHITIVGNSKESVENSWKRQCTTIKGCV